MKGRARSRGLPWTEHFTADGKSHILPGTCRFRARVQATATGKQH